MKEDIHFLQLMSQVYPVLPLPAKAKSHDTGKTAIGRTTIDHLSYPIAHSTAVGISPETRGVRTKIAHLAGRKKRWKHIGWIDT
jgi:hypothetical protein